MSFVQEVVTGDQLAGVHSATIVLAGAIPKVVDRAIPFFSKWLDPEDKNDKRLFATVLVILILVFESVWDYADGVSISEILTVVPALFIGLRAIPEGSHSAFEGFVNRMPARKRERLSEYSIDGDNVSNNDLDYSKVMRAISKSPDLNL